MQHTSNMGFLSSLKVKEEAELTPVCSQQLNRIMQRRELRQKRQLQQMAAPQARVSSSNQP
jgi:hypothetical protein